ncbi:MAG: VWA domain-containing protein [Planctomycetota bacterium]|nr:VWA domain-containing protein [Planctomycetota bacterium]
MGFDSDWSFADPLLLWTAALLPVALLVRIIWRPKAKDFALFRFVPFLPHSHRQHTRSLPLLLQVAAVLLMVLALARPQQQQRLPVEREGIDLLLCLDLSSSMAATDLTVDAAAGSDTRLDFARRAAISFIDKRAEDRIGLVAFARDARLICPPTLDHRSLLTLLDDLEQVPEGREDDATGIGTALARSAVQLRDLPSKSKVVVLLTDGEETVATAGSAAIKPQEAAALCREWGVRVHAIAAGPDAEATRQTLQAVTSVTGGRAFAARDATALEQVYAAIDQLERTRFQQLPWRQVDRYAPFLIAALVLWFLAVWMNRLLWRVRT